MMRREERADFFFLPLLSKQRKIFFFFRAYWEGKIGRRLVEKILNSSGFSFFFALGLSLFLFFAQVYPEKRKRKRRRRRRRKRRVRMRMEGESPHRAKAILECTTSQQSWRGGSRNGGGGRELQLRRMEFRNKGRGKA